LAAAGMKKVCCYIDGFNIYHAIDDMNRTRRGAIDHLKWLDLSALMNKFIDPNVHKIVEIYYFSAYMTWHSHREARHKAYVAALEHTGVKPVMGRFKGKEIYCKLCQSVFDAHEEKESDVNIATHLVSDAYEERFDQAFLVTNDSDLLGPIRLIRERFPEKGIKMIAPPFRRHSKELGGIATHRAKIAEMHLEACRLPESFSKNDGTLVFECPAKYRKPR
jgi:uncharacterized LabA/DUF88 family protein